MDSRRIAEKADLAVQDLIDDGGYLNPEQANKFFEILHLSPTILNQIRKVTMTSPVRNIPRMGFGSRIMRAAPKSGPLKAEDRAAPDLGEITLTTSKTIAEVHIPYDALEDNIERQGMQDTILSMMGNRCALDLEELVILGDTTNTTDDFLALQNGILAATASGNVIDASSLTSVGTALFKLGIHNMPDQYLRNRASMGFYTSTGVETEYRDSLASRATDLGDEKTTKFTPAYAYGVEVRPASLMPDNKVWFADPMNAIMGIQRDIMIETDKDIRAQSIIIVLSMRVALAIEEPNASIVLSGFTDTDL